MRKINILRLSPYFYFELGSADKWDLNYEPLGGMQIQITEQTKAIDSLCGSQVVLTCGLPGVAKTVSFANKTEVITTRVPAPRIRSSSKGMIFLTAAWAIGTIVWAFRNRKNKRYSFDIVHHHTSDLTSTFFSAPIVSWIFKKPLVITVHCSPNFTFHPSTFLEKIFFPLSKYIEKIVARKARHIYVLTERMSQEYIDNKFATADKISVIPDCVDVDFFKESTEPDTKKFRDKYQIPAGKKIISYIGRIAPEKGWDMFIEAIRLLPDKELHFLVCGDGHTKDQMLRAIAKHNLQDRVTTTGYISHTEIPAAISASFCVVLPSYHEELGGVTLETMACRRVIVASEVGGVPYVVKDNENGYLVPPYAADILAGKIRWLLNNTDMLQKVSGNAEQFVRRHYSSKNIALKLYNNYLAVAPAN